jgi:hypothetical protein
MLTYHSFEAVARQVKAAMEKLGTSSSQKTRELKPPDIFLNMYPLYFPGQPGDPDQRDREFAKKPVTRIAVYGTGQGARLAHRWLKRFKHIEKIVFLDRKKEVGRFLRRRVLQYESVNFTEFDLILIGTMPAWVPPILENLKKVSTIPIYFFGA